MWRYTVYVWVAVESGEADVVEQVRAWNHHEAMWKVMRRYGLTFAHTAWVVPANDKKPDGTYAGVRYCF